MKAQEIFSLQKLTKMVKYNIANRGKLKCCSVKLTKNMCFFFFHTFYVSKC